METTNANRSLRTLVVAALLLSVAVTLAPAVAGAQIIICSIYWNSTTDEYSNFCYGSGPGCVECVIIEYSTGSGGGGRLDSLHEGAAAASDAYRLDAQVANRSVGLAAGTGLPRLSLNEAACKEPRLDNAVRTARSERLPAARKDRLRTRHVRELTR